MINRYNFYKNYRAKFGRLNQSQVEGLNFLLDKYLAFIKKVSHLVFSDFDTSVKYLKNFK